MTASAMNRNRSLDVLRGVAILLVIGFHLALPGIFRVGSIGVDLFFVLSGFLISGLLFCDYETLGQIRLGRFWFRRAFKILPPLYTFLAASAGIMFALHLFPGRVFLSTALFFSNYLTDPFSAGAMVGHTWSLAVEEHFYLLCPILLWLLVRFRRDPFSAVPVVAITLVFVCFALRIFDPAHYDRTHLRIDALFAGVTLRYFERFRPVLFGKLASPYALVFGLTFWLPLYFFRDSGAWQHSAAVTWGFLGAAFLVGWCFNHDRARWWKFSGFELLAGVGFYSYSIYLWQQPVTLFFKYIEPGTFFKTCGFVFSIAAGMIMAKLVEMPSLRLREKFSAGARVARERTTERQSALAAETN